MKGSWDPDGMIRANHLLALDGRLTGRGVRPAAGSVAG